MSSSSKELIASPQLKQHQLPIGNHLAGRCIISIFGRLEDHETCPTWLVASMRTSNFGNLNTYWTFNPWFQKLYDLQHLATFSMLTTATAYWKTQLWLNVASCDKPNLPDHIHEWENHGNHPWKIYEQIRLRRSQLSLKFCRCLLQLWDLRVCEANLFNQKVSSSNIRAVFYDVRFKKFRDKSQHLLDLLRWKVILRPWRHRYVMTWPSSKLLMANLKGCKWMNQNDYVYGCFRKWWYPQIIHFNSLFHYKPSILGYPYFWKHTYRFQAVV